MDFVRMCSRLDPKCFKAFLAVVSEGSFSSAAQSAAMTVSGVSQHINAIESAVGLSLFVRTSSGCRLTDQGQRFHAFIKSYSPHFPMLLERRLAHPGLELSVSLVPNTDVLRSIQEGHIDFGFVTERVINPVLQYESFCQEEYVLVGADKRVIEQITPENFMQQRFVVYPGVDVYINCFLRHHFPQMKDVDARSIHHVSGRITTIDGGILMSAGGLGVSVFPRHCVQHLIDSGCLHEFGQPGIAPLMNDIYIATASQVQQPRRVKAVIEWFMDMHKS
jgi:DNA-binding transcriptional LysR family regulator